MNEDQAKEILDKIIAQIFGYMNPMSLEQFKSKYAFDVRLPSQVNDSYTGEATWVQSTNPMKFVTMQNVFQRGKIMQNDNFANAEDWMLKKRPLNTVQDVLAAWEEINATTTEKQIDSLNLTMSDNVNQSENVYHSMDVIESKNIVFSDGAIGCEYGAAIQRSNTVAYSARVEDSTGVSNSFSISWSGKINKSLFIHDAYDLFECMFCSHIKGKRFCIANIQLEEAEYYKIKEELTRWILLGE